MRSDFRKVSIALFLRLSSLEGVKPGGMGGKRTPILDPRLRGDDGEVVGMTEGGEEDRGAAGMTTGCGFPSERLGVAPHPVLTQDCGSLREATGACDKKMEPPRAAQARASGCAAPCGHRLTRASLRQAPSPTTAGVSAGPRQPEMKTDEYVAHPIGVFFDPMRLGGVILTEAILNEWRVHEDE